ncbi:hypothetical protein V5799_034089 [Amblyomma americanum]|uniref:Secreted protein n=1 Tax=Amblyomma americanum TaxID=6943 RepID=A0AAQ4DLG9_AMBAM
MVVTSGRLLLHGALLVCCLLLARALEDRPVNYDVGGNDTSGWDVFYNDSALVFSFDDAANVSGVGEDDRSSSDDEDETVARYDLLPLRNDSAPLLEYREPFETSPPATALEYDVRETLYLLGLFELTGSCEAAKGGRAERAAARLAVRHVNERRVVPGYRLELYDNDTRLCHKWKHPRPHAGPPSSVTARDHYAITAADHAWRCCS